MWRWVFVIVCASGAVAADPEKFRVTGDTLVYDTETGFDGDEGEIEVDDIERLLTHLKSHPDVVTLELNSGGGSVYAAGEMARIVIDFELDTIVAGECVSACIDLFLAGDGRSMTLGSKIGFHQRSWSAGAMESYYDRWREDERWQSPFDFAASVYADTQSEIYEELTYFVDRGVDPIFAISTKRVPTSGAWYPSRRELKEAGVLRDPIGP